MSAIQIFDGSGSVIHTEPSKSKAKRLSTKGAADQRQSLAALKEHGGKYAALEGSVFNSTGSWIGFLSEDGKYATDFNGDITKLRS